MSYTPKKGDIISIDFDPSIGKEITKQRPALVVSQDIFNETTELCMVCPITNGSRQNGLSVILPKELSTTGVVLPWQTRTMDWTSRSVSFVETIESKTLKSVTDKIKMIIG